MTGMMAVSISVRGVVSGTTSGLRRSRGRRCSAGCSGAAATPLGGGHGGSRTGVPPRPRTPSRSDSTCSAAAGPAIAPADRGESARSRRTGERSRGVPLGREAGLIEKLSKGLLDALLAALFREAPCLRPRHDHEVVSRGQVVGRRPEGVPEQPLDPVALNGAAELASNRHTEPWWALVLRTREGVQHEVSARVGPALPIDALELAAARQAPASAPLARAPRGRGPGPRPPPLPP